nr:hypothetical protein [uncultured Carboxylicivirga sp.]
MKVIFLAILLVFIPINMHCQDESKIDLNIGMDVYSRYVWRGLLFSDAPNFQPYITFTAGGFSATAWGSYATSKNYAEVDLFLSYTIKGFTLGLNDYYNEDETDMSSANYWVWDNPNAAHLGEAYLMYSLPNENFPLQLTASMFLYGYDKDVDGNQNNSLYFEALYPFSFKDLDLSLALGGTANDGFYSADGAQIVNIAFGASKTLKITDHFSVPLNMSLIFNPYADDVFFVAGFSF